MLGPRRDTVMQRRLLAPEALTSVSERVRSLNEYGLSLLAQERYKEAITSFNRSTYLQSDNYTAWYARGEALAQLGHYTQALTSFDQAIVCNSNTSEAWVFRGVVLIHLQRYEDALASCDRALEIQPSDREAWIFRGAALQHLGEYKGAYASYDRATRSAAPAGWRPLQWLAKILLIRLGSRSQAV